MIFGNKLERDFYTRDVLTVARELLGKVIVRRVGGEYFAAMITETEAYAGVGDRACHAYGGRLTGRTRVMYRAGGAAYVYFIYGMYHMLNIVAEGEGNPCAVLIRAAVPIAGREAIAKLRFGRGWDELSAAARRTLLSGPGKLCKGLGITMADNGAELTGDGFYLAAPEDPPAFAIEAGKRINIAYAGEAADYPYRFVMKTL
jgi:DNA-3-methyladenine glycosylase